MKESYKNSIEPAIIKLMDNYAKRYEGFEARFSFIQEKRTVTTWVQFREIFKRNLTYLLRNPRTLNAAFFNAIFVGLMVLSLFYKVGDYTRSRTFDQSVQNWLGISLMYGNNMMFPSLMFVII